MSRHSRQMHPLPLARGSRADAGVRLSITQAAIEIESMQREPLCDADVLERLDRATFHLIVAARYIRDPRGMWDLS